jgi:DeoR/GlpR family transcriptional regulator of sugar metabolism
LSTTPDQPNQADDERDVTARETRLDTIVNLLHTHPHLTLSALAEKLTISRTTLYRDLNTLQERGLLSTTKAGTPQNGHSWTVVP